MDCPTCSEKMISIKKEYSQKRKIYLNKEYNCPQCGCSAVVDEDGVIQYFDKNGNFIFGGK